MGLTIENTSECATNIPIEQPPTSSETTPDRKRQAQEIQDDATTEAFSRVLGIGLEIAALALQFKCRRTERRDAIYCRDHWIM